MTTRIVADVGNSRIKWGQCSRQEVVTVASLPLDDRAAWDRQLAEWRITTAHWCLAGVHPDRIAAHRQWLLARAQSVVMLESFEQLPLVVAVNHPETVGIDRLLNAVAALARGTGRPAILIDAGSAVTVDWLDSDGAFRGGAIFPGLALMARALHSYTAKLPLVEVRNPMPPLPGNATQPALVAGVHGAVTGGILFLIRRYLEGQDLPPRLYLTGGDALLLAPAVESRVQAWGLHLEVWPKMTLEGLRVVAEKLW